jgi:hypothetical protein
MFNTIHNNDKKEESMLYEPIFYRLKNDSNRKAFDNLLAEGKVLFLHDEIKSQLQELLKIQNPSISIKKEDYEDLIIQKLNGGALADYGVWVYYPWSGRIVHLLDEDEFIEVRTNRNQFKITKAEQELLRKKKIGIVGLSVGQSIALTMAMERICGEIRLADFDVAELSNLNRLRTGLQNMGLNKTVIAAREIWEIDPFIKVKQFHQGLQTDNMTEFFTNDGKLDLFIEVCDGMDIKIESRYKARELEIPVVMDTNDRGMLDVERFDLEPDRPILHGLADGLDPITIKNLTNEDKIPYILKIVGAESISMRLKASMMEVQQSINTWPQLASSVVLGGAITTDVCRRILLDQFHESGRYYVDMDELVKDSETLTVNKVPSAYLAPPELTKNQILKEVEGFSSKTANVNLDRKTIEEIVNAAIIAPSGGNAQPWKFLYNDQGLFLFHDEHFSYSLLDYNNLGSYVAMGAVIENISIKAKALGFDISADYLPLTANKKMIAHITFQVANTKGNSNYLEKGITMRVTNREVTAKEALSNDVYDKLLASIQSYQGAQLHLITDDVVMKSLGEILAKAEMIRILNPRGHYDTFTNELRWTSEDINQKKDGLDVNTLGASKPELAALKIAEDSEAIAFLRGIKGGTAFTKMVNKAVAFSSAVGIVTMPEYTELDFLKGGRAVERIWIEANLAGVSFQPIAQLVFMMARAEHEDNTSIDADYHEEIGKLSDLFYQLLPELKSRQPVFIFRLATSGEPKLRSLRRPLEASFFFADDIR